MKFPKSDLCQTALLNFKFYLPKKWVVEESIVWYGQNLTWLDKSWAKSLSFGPKIFSKPVSES